MISTQTGTASPPTTSWYESPLQPSASKKRTVAGQYTFAVSTCRHVALTGASFRQIVVGDVQRGGVTGENVNAGGGGLEEAAFLRAQNRSGAVVVIGPVDVGTHAGWNLTLVDRRKGGDN